MTIIGPVTDLLVGKGGGTTLMPTLVDLGLMGFRLPQQYPI